MIPISAPGVYDIDIETYHSQRCCAGPSVSSSSLRKILKECPARFWATSDLNPKPFKAKQRQPLSFGRAAHSLMLGEPLFNSRFVVSPYESFQANPGHGWYADWKVNVSSGFEHRDLIRPSEMETINQMVAAQQSSPEVANAFTDGMPEKSLIWQDAETGIWIKARPDWLPTNPAKRAITEYKTTESLQPRKLSNAVFEYGYEMQTALFIDGAREVLQLDPFGVGHIVQEKDAPWLVSLKIFTPEQIEFGRKEYRKALRIFAQCIKTGVWPGWTEGPSYFDTPYYIAKSMETFNEHIGSGSEYSPGEYLAAS